MNTVMEKKRQERRKREEKKRQRDRRKRGEDSRLPWNTLDKKKRQIKA